MNRPCRTCANLRPGPIGLYVCAAQRLPNPDGEYTHLPTRVGTTRNLFRFGHLNDATTIERAMSPGPVEGWLRDRATGEQRPFVYNQRPCPAWSIR